MAETHLSTIEDNAFFNLPNLQIVGLDYNDLAVFPTDLGNITSISVLSINNNQLTTIPDSITNLDINGNLNIDDNCLDTLEMSTLVKNYLNTASYRGV